MIFNHFYKFCTTIIFFLLIIVKFAYATEDLDEKIKKLTLELRCMTCQNQSVYDSDSDFAKDIKTLVNNKFKEGLDEKEIKLFLTERYGEYILFKPYFNIKNVLLWLFPFILLIFSIVFFIKNIKKN